MCTIVYKQVQYTELACTHTESKAAKILNILMGTYACLLISAAQEWKVVRFLGQSLLHQRHVTRHQESTGELNHVEALAARSSSLRLTSPAVCLPVCLSACLPVCLSACLPVCLSACLPVCLSACLPVCLSACLPVCMSACLPVCLSACLPVCLSACLSVYLSLPACLSLSVSLLCAIFSTDAIMSFRLQGGTSTRTFEREVPDLPKRNQDGVATPEQTTSVDGAVMVTCAEEDGKVVVRSTSAGYNSRTTSFFSYTEPYCMRSVMMVHFRRPKPIVADTTCGFVYICAEPLIFLICCACLVITSLKTPNSKWF